MVRLETLLVIAGMAVITYALRAGGLLLGGRLPRSGPWARASAALPGSVLVAVVVPAMLSEGWVGVIAGTLTAAVMVRTRALPLAMSAGVATVALARLLGA